MSRRDRQRPGWVSFPVELDEGEQPPAIFEGDSYVVELSTGEQLWAVYDGTRGFLVCDDQGDAIDDQRNPLANVTRVCVLECGPGFGPSCPKAGEAPRIHLVVASSPALVKIINESQRKARELLGERFGAAS
jgi:hypothetical protein